MPPSYLIEIRNLLSLLEEPSPRTPDGWESLTAKLGNLVGCKSLPVRDARLPFKDLLRPPFNPVEKNTAALGVWSREWIRILRILNTAEEKAQDPGRPVLLNGIELEVQNPSLSRQMKESYQAIDLDNLLDLLESNGAFHFVIREDTGLIKTSEADENEEMIRQWTTDSVMVGAWQKENQPGLWKRNLLTNAAFILSPECIIPAEKALKNPSWTRQTNSKGEIEEMNGIPHIYLPDSVQIHAETRMPDPQTFRTDSRWFNQKRVESQALILLALARNIRDGLVDQQPATSAPWAFHEEDLGNPGTTEILTRSIAILCAYLVAVHQNPETGRPDGMAPTSGSWEERSYEGGMTWDTALSALALEEVLNLTTALEKSAKQTHRRFSDALKLNGLGGPGSTVENLKATASACRQVVHHRVTLALREDLPVRQSPNRAADTSLLFLAAWDYALDSDPIKNAECHLKLLEQMEAELLRDYGMIRYAPHPVERPGREPVEIFDSYLGTGFWLPASVRTKLITGKDPQTIPDPNEAEEKPGSLESMIHRQIHASVGLEAQWTLGPTACLQGLAKLGLSLLASHGEASPICARINTKCDEYLNRCLASITGHPKGNTHPVYKSNGYQVPAWTVMEAYEAVPTLSGKTAWLPGAHPLAWSRAQLWNGMRLIKDFKSQYHN